MNNEQKYKEALEQIATFKGKTLLGDCCVDTRCEVDEDGCCKLQIAALNAFSQAANIAIEVLKTDD